MSITTFLYRNAGLVLLKSTKCIKVHTFFQELSDIEEYN